VGPREFQGRRDEEFAELSPDRGCAHEHHNALRDSRDLPGLRASANRGGGKEPCPDAKASGAPNYFWRQLPVIVMAKPTAAGAVNLAMSEQVRVSAAVREKSRTKVAGARECRR